ncbi:geranylgeranylglyceryl/heptaprenylglyceryl phosphate synthase [Paenibacillus selenitireducens]|uniref:Heptaprenylglyceryl phosphate synthase n=1 Tax=Paenibacillus selenitireducens TaxID=1324314 RepID=A0A1T2X9I1_9BACL|nr:heptaprenylglyceryl phosphate synthase [Paenibacillus selenitireducens]OPA76346.1 geranylgeranylglyceryl/heptaprenylglyceryl phosphate synthase [Paenibacillus selenitireducens]
MPWRHMFKLDPERTISDEALDKICMSGTDAILVGGSTGVTFDNTVDLLSRIRQYEVPCVLEVSDEEAAVPGFDHYLIPMVLNTKNSDWLIGHQQRAVREFGSMLPWEMVSSEGYIVLNADATVAKLTEALTELEASDVIAYAQVADRLMRLPIVYVEYSGTFGDMDLVRQVRNKLHQAQLFYGGGITNLEQARQAAASADTIIVGNILYDNLEQALQTVEAVRVNNER